MNLHPQEKPAVIHYGDEDKPLCGAKGEVNGNIYKVSCQVCRIKYGARKNKEGKQ